LDPAAEALNASEGTGMRYDEVSPGGNYGEEEALGDAVA